MSVFWSFWAEATGTAGDGAEELGVEDVVTATDGRDDERANLPLT
jgi:hypothetical protein